MSIETDDGPRPIDSCHQLLDSSLDAQHEQNSSVKMEPLSEVEDPYTSFVDSVVTSETQNTAEGKSIMLSGARKVKMNISSQVMEKFLKEGKLEKQPSGSYRVTDSEFKEIETSISGEVNSSENNSVGRPDHILLSADSHSTLEPSNPAVVFRRKRGRPRKGTFIPQTTQSHTVATNHSSKLSSSSQIGNLTCKTSFSPLAYDSTEDPGDAETDTENKPKRKRRSKILDDYVTDFNTSDEEEVNLMNSCSKFTHRGRGRGRGRKVEPLESLDDDLLTSCVGVFGKKFSLNEDILDEDVLEDMSEIDEDIYSPSISNKLKSFNVTKQGSELKEGIEVVLGPDGKTKIQIVDTGETSVVNDEESLIYHVITTTGKTTNVTPLKIPKMSNDAESEDDDKNLPSTSNTKSLQSDEGKADTDVELVDSKPKISSRGRRIKSKQMIRTYNQQVASLQQRYCRAVQELRKKPRVYTLADLVYGASRFLTEDQLIFFTLQLKSGCNNVQGIRFSVREKMLALAFYIQSPALYKWMRVIFHLPTKLILERWLESIAKSDPDAVKRLIYHVYTRYVFRS
nr:uncharacterized protein LOC123760327 isoform X2 [Procambarus clarkii]